MLNGPASLHFLLLLSGLAVLGPGGASAQDLAVADRGPRFLRQVSATEPAVEIDMNATPVLRRRVSLTREAMTLGQILGAIRRQTGLKFIYSTDVVPADRVVGLRADSITVAAALTEILLDAGVDVVFYTAREAGLVLREPPQTGTIAGTVTDGKTGGALAGATVVVDGVGQSATTDMDGRYHIADLAPGTYTVHARFIGYAPRMVSVTVSSDQEATADFALEKSAQRLDEVVTTGTVVPTEVKALPTPVSVITESDIASQRPHTVQELFRQVVPGAVSWDHANAPYYTAFSVRGTSTLAGELGQMKIFVDGVELANASLASVDPKSVARVEVIRGPQAAAIYGSEAIGGVIQIFTKRGDPGLSRPVVDAEARLGLIQTPYSGFNGVIRQNYSASVRGTASQMSYNFGASYTRTEDYLPLGEKSAQSNPSIYGGIRLQHSIITLDVSGRYYTLNTPAVFNPLLAQTGFAFFSKPAYQPEQFQNQTLGARLSLTPKGWLRSELTVGFDHALYDRDRSQPRLTTPADTFLLVFNRNQAKALIGLNTSVHGLLSRNVSGSVTVGVDHWSLSTSQFQSFSTLNTSGTITPAPGGSISAARLITNNTGYFAQAQLGLRDALFLTGGVRAENNSDFGDRLGTPLSPRVGFSFVQPVRGATLKFRSSYGRAIRAPTTGLKLGSVSTTSIVLANPELGPERQHGWDAGIDVAFGSRGSLSATYYDQIADDLIQFVVLQNTPPRIGQSQNVGRVENTGIEVEGSLIVGPVGLKAQYAYARSRIDQLAPNYDGDLRVGDQAMLTPKHTAGASLTFAPLRRTTVVAGVTYVGSWNYYSDEALFRCIGGTGPCQSTNRDYIVAYPRFTKVNVAVSQQIATVVEGFVLLENLTNNHAYEATDDNPVMGRITTVGVRLRY